MNDYDNRKFSEIYCIDPDVYSNISILDVGFSVRVCNCLKRAHVNTVAELAKLSYEALLRIKGFGKGCVDELEAFFENIKTNKNSGLNESIDNFDITKKDDSFFVALDYIGDNIEAISVGDFSFIEQLNLTPNYRIIAEKVKQAIDVLGKELVLYYICKPEEISNYYVMFKKFIDNSKYHCKLLSLLHNIPQDRAFKKAYGFIHAYTLEEELREHLKKYCFDCNTSISDMVLNYNSDSYDDCILMSQFLEWCTYDLKKEIFELFEKVYEKERAEIIISGRARGKTLEEIGNDLGITRERIRQIESKAKRVFTHNYSRYRIISKIYADRNGDSVITEEELESYFEKYTPDIKFLLRDYKSANFSYDVHLGVFVVGDDSLQERAQSVLDALPDMITVEQYKDVLELVQDDYEVSKELFERAFASVYKLTGSMYHRCRLSLSKIYEVVINKYYNNGIKVYDPDEMEKFREIILADYGDVGLPESNRALSARIADICILYDRGVYISKKDKYISDELSEKIYNYIMDSPSAIISANTIFYVFEDELVAQGIKNRYYLHGILRELYGLKLEFTRDYVVKEPGATSIYGEIKEFIKKYSLPVNKNEIKNAFPGISDVVITFAVDDKDIINYYGEYLHSSKLNITVNEINCLDSLVSEIVSDGLPHHGKDVFDYVYYECENVFSRNAAMNHFSVFSMLESLFNEKYQFLRPYIAKKGVEIGRSGERLHEMICSQNSYEISDIREFCKDNHFQIQSMLEYLNGYNDSYLLIDSKTIMRIDEIGITEEMAVAIESILLPIVSKTIPICQLDIWHHMPEINIPWTDWLLYSVLNKWGTTLSVATSSNQIKQATPLISPKGMMNTDEFSNFENYGGFTVKVDDLDNIDDLIGDIIGDEILEDI